MPPTMTCNVALDPPAAGLVLSVDVAAGQIVLTGELDRETCGQLAAVCPVFAAADAPVAGVGPRRAAGRAARAAGIPSATGGRS
jgi:hypothetical protein